MVASGLGPLLFAAGSFLPTAITSPSNVVFAIVLLLLSLALMFGGRSIFKGLAFLVVGFAGAVFGLTVGALFLGVVGAIVGGVLGFIVGGVVGVLLVHIGMGVALGYFGYLIVLEETSVFLLAVLVGIVLFFVGVALSNKLLELVTAVLGGIILYGVLVFFSVSPPFAALISAILAIVGFLAQRRMKRRNEQWRHI